MGSVARRRSWLEQSTAAVAGLRREGVPLVGYTWWPMFALVTWAYRQGHRQISDHLAQMGLWDLDANLNRIPTPLVDTYRTLVSGGSNAAGRLNDRQALEGREGNVPQLLSSGL
jgi:hypothetical protein